MQQHKLYETMGVLHQKIDQYELNGEVFDENLRIISEQRRIMQDLHVIYLFLFSKYIIVVLNIIRITLKRKRCL